MKKLLSIILSIVILLTVFAGICFSSSAATFDPENNVYINADGKYFLVEKGQVYHYEYYINIDNGYTKISSIHYEVFYDNTGLEYVIPYNEYGEVNKKDFCPLLDGAIVNPTEAGHLYCVYSQVDGVRLPQGSILFKGDFKVTADSGVFSISTYMKILAEASPDLPIIIDKNEIVDDSYSVSIEEAITDDVPYIEESEVNNPTVPDIKPTETEPVPTETEPAPTETEPTETEPTETQPATTDFILGDVDGDGKINVFDATAIQRFSAEIITLTDLQQAAADVNGDGKINIFDATMIQRFVAEIIPSLGG